MAMFVYLLKRLLLMIPTFLGITLVVFFVIQSAPGGPVEQFVQEITMGDDEGGLGEDLAMSEELIDELKIQFGFDKPIYVRYFLWIKDLFTLNFGESYVYEESVVDVIISKFPVSLSFGISSLFLTYLVCIPLGIAKALKDKTAFDYASSVAIFLAYSTPGFVLGVLLIVFFGGGSFWDVFPIGGLTSDEYETFSWGEQIVDRLYHAVLPVTCYVLHNFAALTMLMKNSLIGELRLDYVKTAVAKGVPRFGIIYKHALRNALIPVVAGMGGVFSIIFAGSVLIETVFNLDGIGLLTYTSVLKRDYTVIMASVSLHSILIMLGNLFSDFMMALVDPRIDFN